ncbi:beta-galactosidase [Agromyces cerinus subsp. nitratus]|uniref:beta-galactosidase n=1 Tax=Agromyces cerinus TaxID=33878 RepID=UPI003631FC65
MARPDAIDAGDGLATTTVETYLAWNVHEPREGQWQRLDEITRFLDCRACRRAPHDRAAGPYICAEWDNGGLPSWLTGRVGKHVRTSHPEFMDAVGRYLDAVVPTFVDQPQPAHGTGRERVRVVRHRTLRIWRRSREAWRTRGGRPGCRSWSNRWAG